MVGTCNRDDFLRDATGHRRFLVIETGQIDCDRIAADRDRIWRAAVLAYRKGEPAFLLAEDQEASNRRNKSFELENPVEATVGHWLRFGKGGDQFTLDECLAGIERCNLQAPDRHLVKEALKEHGCISATILPEGFPQSRLMDQLGCLYLLLITFIGQPVYLVLFAMSARTTILFTIFASSIAIYTRQEWLHIFTSYSETSNKYTRKRKAEKPVRKEVEVITKMLLGDPDLDCKATKGNGLTIEEAVDIHFKRLNKYGRSK